MLRLATLAILRRPGAYERIHATGKQLMGALRDLLRGAGIAAQISGEPPLWVVPEMQELLESSPAAGR